MADDEDEAEQWPMTLVEQVAENMAIYANRSDDEAFMAQAEQLLRMFESKEGRSATSYAEIEEWSKCHLDPTGRFLVLTSPVN